MLGGYRSALAFGASCLLAAVGAGAQSDDPSNLEPVRCISMGGVRTTKIVDDNRVLFYLSNGRIYENRLDRTCLGLSRSGVFSYQVQSGARYVRVCDSDAITVLESAGRGFSCGLGQFVPVSVEGAAELLGAERSATPRIESQAVTLPEPAPAPAETQQKE